MGSGKPSERTFSMGTVSSSPYKGYRLSRFRGGVEDILLATDVDLLRDNPGVVGEVGHLCEPTATPTATPR